MRESKFKKLPIHHIDTSVFLGAFFEEEEFYDECKSYLNRIGYKYLGCVSTSVAGEIFMILEKENIPTRELMFEFLDRTIVRRKISFAPADFKTFELINLIKVVNYKLDPLDAEHLATAVSKSADVFITLDGELLENKRLEDALGIKIMHPKFF